MLAGWPLRVLGILPCWVGMDDECDACAIVRCLARLLKVPAASPSKPSLQAPAAPFRSPRLDITRVPLNALHADPANARQHGDRNLDAIRASLTTFGQVEPLVVHKPTQRVIGGNGRLSAMKALGWTHADVVELDVSETQATALGIALNRTAELMEWDLPSLGARLQSLPR